MHLLCFWKRCLKLQKQCARQGFSPYYNLPTPIERKFSSAIRIQRAALMGWVFRTVAIPFTYLFSIYVRVRRITDGSTIRYIACTSFLFPRPLVTSNIFEQYRIFIIRHLLAFVSFVNTIRQTIKIYDAQIDGTNVQSPNFFGHAAETCLSLNIDQEPVIEMQHCNWLQCRRHLKSRLFF
jgi:hypothetical protein